jgi:hypothetical protein
MQFERCPGCGASATAIQAPASSFQIVECDKCDERFCFKCPRSNGGRDCPECDCDDVTVVGLVHRT